ncbi:mechanosensitive ion channel domain-containing protein [Rheinheimera sp.]|uniref:mechanosensitive ion channel domain-containing protein n=1 Tax=Rheinheimera sp. TaxID=1869214 RepID=UPI003AF5E915
MLALRRFSIRQRLLLNALIVGVAMLVMLALLLFQGQKLTQLAGLRLEVEQLQLSVLQLRRSEKDFLLRSELEYQQSFNQQADLLASQGNSLMQDMQALGLDTAALQNFLQLTDNYRTLFNQLVAVSEQVGLDPQSGLYGALRKSAHELEQAFASTQDFELSTQLLQLRRAEKDFMLRLDLKYLQSFQQGLSQFNQLLQQKITDPAQAASLVEKAASYGKAFEQLVQGEQQIGLAHDTGLMGQMRQAIHQTEQSLEQMSLQSSTAVDNATAASKNLAISLFVLVLVAVISLVQLTSRSILKPIEKVCATIGLVRKDNDFRLRIDEEGQDEMTTLARDVNHMLSDVQDLVRSVNQALTMLDQATAELAQSTADTSKGMSQQQLESDMVATAVTEMGATVNEIAANTEQSRRLMRTGLIAASLVGMWLIWVDVLPALRLLDQWPLWTTKVIATAETDVGPNTLSPWTPRGTEAETPVPPQTTEVIRNVTIADLGFAVLIGIVTVICARNVPGLMEISVLQRLPLDKSFRYAVTSVTSYGIMLLGVVLAFNAVSVGWSKVQWLATALTFGLAFGLQEIFANFVAGIILLFEQPIRVGDVVTVDDVSGVVSRIRIRATTITNWDRKEYVIPNKEFITGRMLNWTLSDKTNRIVINVGVAYGSDVERAKELLRRTCQDHPLILKDPPTLVTFEGFGDNCLNLVVRTFLPDLDNRLPVIDELHTAIDRAFRQSGVEIAFPQRDLHVRSIDQAIVAGFRRKAA